MNTKIFAYTAAPTQTAMVLDLPKGAEILEIANNPLKGGAVSLWALVNPEAKETERRVLCAFEVGQQIPHNRANLRLVSRTIVLTKSEKSNPGGLSAKNAFWFEAIGPAAEHYIEIDEATKAAAS